MKRNHPSFWRQRISIGCSRPSLPATKVAATIAKPALRWGYTADRLGRVESAGLQSAKADFASVAAVSNRQRRATTTSFAGSPIESQTNQINKKEVIV